jgi:hypothetical protein
MRRAAIVSLALVAALAGCGGESEPVARLSTSQGVIVLPHGVGVSTELRFEPLRPLDEGKTPLVFAHLLDAEGTVMRTFDHALAGEWRVGELIVDRVPLAQPVLGPALPRGEYRLTVGLYDGGDRRWALQTSGEEVARREYVVARVRVPELDPEGPSFAFSEEWLPVEPTGDRQTLARRWLSGDGTLRVARLPAPAELSMQLRIPQAEGALRLVLEPGASVPTVRVTTDCSGFAATVQGAGFHTLSVPVPPPGGCLLRFDSNYTLVDSSSPRRLSVALEQLAWSRSAGSHAPADPTPAAPPTPATGLPQPAAAASPAPPS